MYKPNVTVILLNWNGWQDTIQCLESVFKLDYPNFNVIVCDNNSKDASIEHIKSWADGIYPPIRIDGVLNALITPPLQKPIGYIEFNADKQTWYSDKDVPLVLIQTGENLGFAGGNNVGARYALEYHSPDFLWFLNNDTVVDPSALSELVARVEKNSRLGIVGSTLRYFDAPHTVQAYGGATFNPLGGKSFPIGEGGFFKNLTELEQIEVEQRIRYIIGASMLVSSDFLKDVGLMQEDYFLYYEELDWAERARRHQPEYQLGFAPRSIVYHKVGAVAGSKTRSLFSLRYLYINQLRFMKRFYPEYFLITKFFLMLEAIKSLINLKISESVLFVKLFFLKIKL